MATQTEFDFVRDLAGDVSDGRGPNVAVVDRDGLDDWMADDPIFDKYLQRDPTTALAADSLLIVHATNLDYGRATGCVSYR